MYRSSCDGWGVKIRQSNSTAVQASEDEEAKTGVLDGLWKTWRICLWSAGAGGLEEEVVRHWSHSEVPEFEGMFRLDSVTGLGVWWHYMVVEGDGSCGWAPDTEICSWTKMAVVTFCHISPVFWCLRNCSHILHFLPEILGKEEWCGQVEPEGEPVGPSLCDRAQGAKPSVRVSKQSTSLHPWLAGHGDSGLPAGNGKANWGEPFHPMLLVQPLLAHRTLWEVFCGLWSSVVKYKRLKMNCRGSGGKWQWDLPGPSDVFTLRKSRLQSSNIGIKRGREKPHLDHMRLAGLRALKALLRASVSGAPTAHKVKHPHFSLVELWGLSEDAGHVPRWEDLHLTGQWELRQDIYSWWGPSWDSLERSN